MPIAYLHRIIAVTAHRISGRHYIVSLYEHQEFY